jgi:hypothetical protein
MGQHGSLGVTGGARGVQHEAGVVGGGVGGVQPVGGGYEILPLPGGDGPSSEIDFVAGQQHDWTAIAEDALDLAGRQPAVEYHGGGAERGRRKR